MKIQHGLVWDRIIILFILFFGISYYSLYHNKNQQKEDQAVFVYNLNEIESGTLQSYFELQPPSSIRRGSLALHADGLQSYAEWIKLWALSENDLSSIVDFLQNEFSKRKKAPVRFTKHSINEYAMQSSGVKAPLWWDPSAVKTGYILTAGITGPTILVDSDRFLVYFIASD
jgi:hypothetical protein